jgi:hypothetical protein
VEISAGIVECAKSRCRALFLQVGDRFVEQVFGLFGTGLSAASEEPATAIMRVAAACRKIT